MQQQQQQIESIAKGVASLALKQLPVNTANESDPSSSSYQKNALNRDVDLEEAKDHQLSEDLALFLANPSLRAALADGSLDLASYSGQVEEELLDLEASCIQVYRDKAGEIVSLRSDLQECQSVLSSLQEMLLGFQADLGGLSGEIRQLQEKSRTLDVQLKNRREAEEGFRQFLEHIIVAPNLVHAITTGSVNTAFLQSVQEINQIYKNTHSPNPQPWSGGKPPSDTVAGKQVQEQVRNLRLLAVSRVRDYFLSQLVSLRQPQTNIRMIQVNGLLKYAELQDFLEEASPEIATEILNVYTESMGKTLQQLFRTYQAQLLQLDLSRSSSSRHEVLAMDDALLRDTLTTRAKKRVDVFCLGTRATECLDEDASNHAQPILAHVALAERQRYHYERLFRSILGHLVDAVTNEHVFGRQFFKRDIFTPLFQNTLSLLLEQSENYLFGCYDALCLLLMIKVTHYYRRLMRSRKVHSLDGFFDQLTNLLWPRLKTVMEGHLRSLKQATAVKLGGVDLHPHVVSRRFAEFCCSILLILQNKAFHKQHGLGKISGGKSMQSPPAKGWPVENSTPSHAGLDDSIRSTVANRSAGDMLLEDLTEMVDAYVALMERLSDEHTSQKSRVVFWINNLDAVVCIFQERRVVGKEFNRVVELLMQQREVFVEEELLTGFSKMIAFVQQTEAHMATTPRGETYNANAAVVEALVLDFASKWKGNIDVINRNVLSYFSNFRNGMEILKQVLTQLLLYYTRFQDIIRKVWKNRLPPFCENLISTNIILTEIKRYALAI
jgi:hypothetical protein